MICEVINRRDYGGGMPRGCKSVDRNTPYGNPFHISAKMTRDQCIDAFEVWIKTQPDLIERARRELTGFNLACWCAPKRCHANVWLKILQSR